MQKILILAFGWCRQDSLTGEIFALVGRARTYLISKSKFESRWIWNQDLWIDRREIQWSRVQILLLLKMLHVRWLTTTPWWWRSEWWYTVTQWLHKLSAGMKHWPDFLRPFSTKVCSTNVREVLQAIISVVCVSSPGSLSKNNTVFKNYFLKIFFQHK